MTISTSGNDVSSKDVEEVLLGDFYPDSTQADMVITRPSDLFLPDEWTKTFAAGLVKLADSDPAFSEKHVMEIGVGTGINMAGLMTLKKRGKQIRVPKFFIGTDIDPSAVTASRGLASRNGLSHVTKFTPSSLLDNVSQSSMAEIGHIIACIPQVPSFEDLSIEDRVSHYYTPEGDKKWDKYGLGLNASLLRQAKSRELEAQVTLNLSGRPGLRRLCELFTDMGYMPEVLHEDVVQQHAGTSLESLASLEGEGVRPFEFFESDAADKEIYATEAYDRQLKSKPVWHKVYVITGTRQPKPVVC